MGPAHALNNIFGSDAIINATPHALQNVAQNDQVNVTGMTKVIAKFPNSMAGIEFIV